MALLDQGHPATAAALLRDNGWDAFHVRDFPKMLALTGAACPSVVLIRLQRLRAAELAALLISAWQENEYAIDAGCVLKISARGLRIRLLPLK